MLSNSHQKGLSLLHLLFILVPISIIVIFTLKSLSDSRAEQRDLDKKQKQEQMLNDYKNSVLQLKDVYARWSDAMKIANSAPRVALANHIKDMQEIRRDAEKINVPPCLYDLKSSLLLTMDSFSDVFISFLANESQEKTDANYKNANEVLGDYINNKIGLISTCKPDSVTSPAYKDYIAL